MSLHLFLLLLLSPLPISLNAELYSSSSSSFSSWNNVRDQLALLAFKAQIRSDPHGILDAWNQTVSFCEWPGVLCDSPTRKRVTAINLAGMMLGGSLSPSLANLSSLDGLNLQENAFFGTLPRELGRLALLKTLNLSFNSLTGSLPDELANCTNLRFLNLQGNRISSKLPLELGTRLSSLLVLNLDENLLTGTIPPSLGNLTSLTELRLSGNRLSGSIPENLGALSSLIFIQLSYNNLEGEVPPSLYNVSSSLQHFSLSNNRLIGSIPADFGLNFPNIRNVLFAGNNFSGKFPASITNASHIELLDFSQNNFGGDLPEDIGRLSNLRQLNLERNRLTGGATFLLSLSNCTRLQFLSLYSNNMTGVVPEHSLVNLSSDLSILLLGENKLSGSIPEQIDRLINLKHLSLRSNSFSGSIPFSIGKLVNLRKLSLLGNSFSGEIPASIGNLTNIIGIDFGNNLLRGEIPPSIGNLSGIRSLSLQGNMFSGSIPKSIFAGITNLTEQLDLSVNNLSGNLPPEIGLLTKVQAIDVSGNRFSGNIPESVGNCTGLQSLDMASNSFDGPIPESLSQIRGIMDLDLSKNRLSGEIPDFLADLQFLWSLNLSFNDFHGRIPQRGVFMTLNSSSFMGNPHLCGPKMKLPPCMRRPASERNRDTVLILTAAISVLGLFLLLLLSLFFKILIAIRVRESVVVPSTFNTTVSDTIIEMQNCCKPVSYKDLYRATDGFGEENLMGIGKFGRVYRGILGDGEAVAVKVLDPQQRGAMKSFLRECEALRSIRHRNLLKIITLCSSVDAKGSDFMALVLEFMLNGSLEGWLHPRTGANRSLSLMERVRIAMDVAFAMDYLHNDYSVPIVHCDLKPGNVLLDRDMTAHVCDFGLARCLPAARSGSTRCIQGSFGYIPPEYAMGGQVTTEGDVYSFGILLLELFTGRRPTDDMFVDGLTLTKLASTGFPARVIEIVDPSMLEEHDAPNSKATDGCGQASSGRSGSGSTLRRRCLVAVIRLGLHCAAESSRDRPNMREVVKELEGIRSLLLLGPLPASENRWNQPTAEHPCETPLPPLPFMICGHGPPVVEL